MLTFFRNFTKSKFGLPLVLAFVALIAVAFAASDITGTGFFNSGQGGAGSAVAEIGDRAVTETEVDDAVKNAYAAQRQQNPLLELNAFINQGGFEDVLAQLINLRALETLAETTGIAAGRTLIDGQIASSPAFFGPTGRFDDATFRAWLEQRRMSEAELRNNLRGELLARQLIVPSARDGRLPLAVARQYAALSLETRRGQTGFVSVGAIPPGPPPTAQEVDAFYSRRIADYTTPERRVIRYALFGLAQLGDAARPTEAEIVNYYRTNAARYAAGETRTLTQVILSDQNAARALEARVRGGASLAAAAQAAGRETATLAAQTRAGFGGLASAAVASAAFATAEGQIAAPTRSPLGWHVVRVDAINRTPARTLDQVRAEITPIVAREKGQRLLADLSARIEDAVADGATFDEVVAANRLQVVSTPPIDSAGRSPDNAAFTPDPAFARFITPMFEAEPDDDPQIETVVPEEQFVLSDLDRVIPAAPRPLAQIRAQVAADLAADTLLRRAGETASQVAARVNRGVPLAQAMREANLPAPRAIGGRRRDLSAGGTTLSPDVRRLFDMAPRTAKRVAAPNRSGWYVVALESISTGDSAADPRLIPTVQREFVELLGSEYAAQLANAAKAELGVKRNAEAEAALRRRLTGTGGQ